ncbi:hypothetical protein [Parachitinimonas caeni]|uniref:Uncharacterized protein n=1 Tax=Parachitinimonas caeni TaxID=3031301 RepID=A0ABT7DX66_9NEIS|nr:hypothetical protein [Parachitinimonas caeni]MDK2123760.1 hypothetical protein [Parachitinimonas caeni]
MTTSVHSSTQVSSLSQTTPSVPVKVESGPSSLQSASSQPSKGLFSGLSSMFSSFTSYPSKQADAYLDEHMITPLKKHVPEAPIKEGIQDAFSSRGESMGRLMSGELPGFSGVRKTVSDMHELYTFSHNGGTEDVLSGNFPSFGQTTDIVKAELSQMDPIKAIKHSVEGAKVVGAVSLASGEMRAKVIQTTEDAYSGQMKKIGASVGTSIVVGKGMKQAGSMAMRLPHPAAKLVGGALYGGGVFMQASGLVKGAYDVSDVSEKISDIHSKKGGAHELMSQIKDYNQKKQSE